MIIFTTFKRRSGLYFWSFTISTWGVAIWSLGFLLKDTGVISHIPNNYLLYMTFIEIGFVTMVTGQSFVLYSRLHIVVHSRRKLRLAFSMIIFDAIICHVPIIVVAFGTNSPHPGPFVEAYSVYEKVQVTIFFIQELILSGLYIRETIRMMGMERHTGLGNGGSRKLMRHLVLVNVIIIALDITILGLEYAHLFQLQTAYKGLVYSVKLKMEFSILNRLVEMVRGTAGTSSSRGHATVARSRVDRADVPMQTFTGIKSVDRDGHIRLQDVEDADMGHNAFAHRGDRGDTADWEGDGRQVITRTIEVSVHRDDPEDSDSPRGGARKTVSTSSSEIQFAKA